MKSIHPSFEPVLQTEADALWRLCFLLTRSPEAAETLCFEALLRLAAAPDSSALESRAQLYAAACRLCGDWYIRKPRRRAKETALQEADLPFALTPGVRAALDAPYARRCALGLLGAGFSAPDIRNLAGGAAAREAERLSPEAAAPLEAVRPSPDLAQQLSDLVYDRFSERNVPLENRLHAIHAGFERAAPWLALAVLLFFAFCVWFVGR